MELYRHDIKNKCYNFIKKNKKLSLVESEQVFEQSSEICNLLESQLIKEEAGAFLNTLIRGLKYPYKEVIYLQYYDGLNSREIAEILGISPANVRKISSRARGS
ncbi:RNA polymerase sigma factor [Anaerobutyricum hallii]|uniref:RNA polymerase sigma factor n=1 Tax=Anaerobutyricum hallii TaxID=39488 RepID=UPI001FAA9834|nr:sigma-70 family RNA polymerase sigma factor [Anaerobutyricum hallii]